MLVKLLLSSLLSGVFELDETGAFQLMFSRSMISGACIGLVLGYCTGQPGFGLKYGFFFGLFFDLIWIFRLPIGANVPPDYQVASSVSIGSFVLGVQFFKEEYLYIYFFICLMTGYMAGYIGGWVDII
ncbi:MAG TPA: hypothetical protein ENN73_04555, partial [Firmicutes bacterium]|nr:hypothetical protein [Bacillota bacterium]